MCRLLPYSPAIRGAGDQLSVAERIALPASPQLRTAVAAARHQDRPCGEAVKIMHRRAAVSGGRRSSPLMALAARCRAV